MLSTFVKFQMFIWLNFNCFGIKNDSIPFSRLEKSINSYKEEYAQLISQAEAIKTDLKHVQVRTILIKN